MSVKGVNLEGKVAVVTGGLGVLGEEFCSSLLAAGASVAILDLNEKAGKLAEEKYKALGYENILCLPCSVLKKQELEEARSEIHHRFGTCDILLNGAGGNHPGGTTSKDFFEPGDEESSADLKTFFNLELESVQFVFNLNFMGTLLPSQVFSQDMVKKKNSSIINISSMNAFTPLTRIPAYSGAKAAISNLTSWMAVHFAKTNIRVNAIAPGFFETAQNQALLRNQDGSYSERAQKILSQTPKGRFGKASELTGTLMFLLDEDASGFITGVVIPVDGGFSSYSGV